MTTFAAGCEPRQSPPRRRLARSEEHTSELQSRQYLVCRLLLEKKTTRTTITTQKHRTTTVHTSYRKTKPLSITTQFRIEKYHYTRQWHLSSILVVLSSSSRTLS